MEKGFFSKSYLVLTIVFLGILAVSVSGAMAKGPIVIGNVCDMTGSTSTVGVPTGAGQQHFFEYLNEKGGIYGYKIKSVMLDGKETITSETRQFNRLVTKEKAVAIIGWSTPGSRALMPAATRAGIAYLGRTCSRAAVNPEKYPFSFIPTPTYLDQHKIALDYAKSQGGKTVVIVHDDIEAWKTTARIIIESGYIEKIGLKLLATVVEPIKATDVTVQMLRIKKLNPDFIITPNTAGPMIPTLRDAAKVGVDVNKIIGGTVWGVHTVIAKKLGQVAKGYKCVQVYPLWGGDNDVQKEIDEFGKRHPDKTKKFHKSNFYIQGWMLGKAFAVALEKVLKDNGGKAPSDLKVFRKQFRDVYASLKGPIFGKGLPSVDNGNHKLIGQAYLVRFDGVDYKRISDFIKVD